MCSSEYDLVCEECREKFDRIFSVRIESAEQERRLLAKWWNHSARIVKGC